MLLRSCNKEWDAGQRQLEYKQCFYNRCKVRSSLGARGRKKSGTKSILFFDLEMKEIHHKIMAIQEHFYLQNWQRKNY